MRKTLALLLNILYATPAIAGCLAAAPEINLGEYAVGRECTTLSAKARMYVKNKGASPVWVRIAAGAPDPATLREGYEAVPKIVKVTPDKELVYLAPNESREIGASVFLPKSRALTAKKYQAGVTFSESLQRSGGQVSVVAGVESVILLSTFKNLPRTDMRVTLDPKGCLFEDALSVSLSIPAGAVSRSVEARVLELDGADVPGIGKDGRIRAIAAYRFLPEGTIFKKPVRVKMYYPDYDGDGIVDGTDYDASTLALYFWNGRAWEPIGGEADKEDMTVSADLYHFSVYALFPAGQGVASSYIPARKIITPARADGRNDYISFPGLQGEYHVDIFDATGMKVARLENKNVWYGLDGNGNMVESGPYIYRYEIEIEGARKVITGVVVVAK